MATNVGTVFSYISWLGSSFFDRKCFEMFIRRLRMEPNQGRLSRGDPIADVVGRKLAGFNWNLSRLLACAAANSGAALKSHLLLFSSRQRAINFAPSRGRARQTWRHRRPSFQTRTDTSHTCKRPWLMATIKSLIVSYVITIRVATLLQDFFGICASILYNSESCRAKIEYLF